MQRTPSQESADASRLGETALKDIRFSPLSAAGPTGARHEHTKELLKVKRRCIARRYLKLLEELLDRWHVAEDSEVDLNDAVELP